jgi:zinc protease
VPPVSRLLALGCLLGLGAARPAAAAPWADLPSDLPPDPAVRSGTLANGLRFVIRPNPEPKDRVSLRLLVSAGSLHERDDERGLAHFLEHMAFRGTAAFPQNQLTTTLERRGIGLGPDNTAFTSYDYTVYHLELPDTTAGTLRLGLTVFREYASGLTLDAAAIEKERGVVLSEKDTRNTPQERLGDANLWSLWPDSRQYRRSPIGLESCIRRFTRDQFVAFYDAWYRPERMAVIIVGDVVPADAERLVAEVLGPLSARAPPRPEPADLVPAQAGEPNVAMFVDESLAGVRFLFTHPRLRPRPPDTHAERVTALHRALAFAMFAKRLEWATRRRNGSYVAPSVSTEFYLPGWDVVSFSASGRIDDWRRLAADLEQEHRRAFQLGFAEDELKLAKAGMATSYEQAVRSASTRRSESLAGQIAGTLLYGGVLTTPEAAQRDLAADLEAATLPECVQAFRSAWTSAAPHVLVATNSLFPNSRQEVGRVLNESRSTPVRLRPAPADVAFAYKYFGDPGKLAADEFLPDLDVHLARFGNGVRLNFKPTPFEADTVRIVVRVGTGKLSQPADQPGLDYLASYGFINGGLVLHSSEELDALLSHHVLNIQFGVEPDACAFYAQCARRDLPLTMRMIAAYLTDPAYRAAAMAGAQASFGTLYSNFDATSGGAISLRAERVLAGANPRVGPPESNEAYARTFQELAQWLGPQLAHGAVELSIVGDATWTEAADAVSRTLGALPPRDAYPRPDRAANIAFTAPYQFPRMIPISPALKQTAIAWYWPMPELSSAHQDRRCRLLAAVLGELLFTRLREELGATYTPAADFVQYDGWPTFSYFTLRADVASAQGPKAAQVIRREIETLLAKGIDEDVFRRARQPFLRSREQDLRDNGYWSHTVLRDAQLHPERLAAARDRATDTAAIARPELEAIARRFLDPSRGFLFIAEPGPTSGWGARYMWGAK